MKLLKYSHYENQTGELVEIRFNFHDGISYRVTYSTGKIKHVPDRVVQNQFVRLVPVRKDNVRNL